MDDVARMELLLDTLVRVAVERREEYDRLDAVAGDGDFGSTLLRGAYALSGRELDRSSPGALLRSAAQLMTDEMGGTSGPLWGIALIRAGAVADEDGVEPGAMLRAAVEGVQEYGGAQVGDKTLLDALSPASEALEAGDLAAAARAAREGADGTASMTARRGRASYTGERSAGEPDPGAVAVAEILERLAERWDGSGEADLASAAAGADEGTEEDSGPADPRKFLDDPSTLVADGARGLALAHPGRLRWDEQGRVMVRADAPVDGQVALVSGGGSGHEPLHAGFVGPGMLAAACPGAIFTSPAPGQMLAAAQAVDGGAGVLFVVKNYTGDVLNFRLAAELAEGEGIETRSVLVDDDAAVEDSEAGRRGTGATVLVEKIAGARAAAGGSLDEVAAVAERVVERSASFGVALAACTLPGGGEAAIDIPEGKLELGVGIHGEPGRATEDARSASDLVPRMLEPVLERLDPSPDARLLAFVNGLGATTSLELHLLFGILVRELESRDLRVERSLVGPYVTSLDMAGASLTLLELDDELIELWDAPVDTPALTFAARS